jgi:hypothetical protein
MTTRVKCSFSIRADLMAALKIYSAATGKDMSTLLEEAIEEKIPQVVKDQAEDLTRMYGKEPVTEKTPKPKVKRAAPTPGQEEAIKLEGFDGAFWQFLEEKNIGSNTVAAKLTEAGHSITPEGVRYWKKSKKGIPAVMVEQIRMIFPELHALTLALDEQY